MRVLMAIISSVAASTLVASRPTDAGRPALRNVPAVQLEKRANAGVANWTSTELTQLGALLEQLEVTVL